MNARLSLLPRVFIQRSIFSYILPARDSSQVKRYNRITVPTLLRTMYTSAAGPFEIGKLKVSEIHSLQ